MSFFKTCEDCNIEIKSYEYIFCDSCLVKHLKCQVCTVQITKKDDENSLGNMLCKGCFNLEKLVYNDRSFDGYFQVIKVRLEEEFQESFSEMSMEILRAKWENCASMIKDYALASWNCKKDEEQSFRNIAIEYQKLQTIIQREITKRSQEIKN